MEHISQHHYRGGQIVLSSRHATHLGTDLKLYRFFFVLMAVGLFSSLSSANPQTARSDDNRLQVSGLEKLVLSYDLAHFGRAEQDAASLILATRIRLSVDVSDADLGGVVTGPSPTGQWPQSDEHSVSTYLDLAERYARGNRAQLAEIAALRALEDKEVIAHDYDVGALRHSRLLAVGSEWTFEVIVAEGRPVMIAAIGDGDSAIRLSVSNEAGQQVAGSPANDYRAVVEWNPLYEQRFSVTVSNLGEVESHVAVFSD